MFFLLWRNSPSGQRPPHYRGFTITVKHTTLGRTPMDELSARRRDLYLTTPVWKDDCKMFCPMSRICPVTARPVPQWQISSQHFAPLPICGMFHSQCYLVAMVIRIQSLRCRICAYVHLFLATFVGQKNKKKLREHGMPCTKRSPALR